MIKHALLLTALLLSPLLAQTPVTLKENQSIVLIGGGTFSRMMKYNEFETELHYRYPALQLRVRNQADDGDTPAFRPHPSREHKSQFAFPGAKALVPIELQNNSEPKGHRQDADGWLKKEKADLIIACFGSNEHFRGPKGFDAFKRELDAFITHTLKQTYNGSTPPQLILVSPTAFQNLSNEFDVPDGIAENRSLALYANGIRDAAKKHQIPYVDLFTPTKKIFNQNLDVHYTLDSALLNRKGFQLIAQLICDQAFVKSDQPSTAKRKDLFNAVSDKNWHWHNLYKMPNGVHVEGRRYDPHGPKNYPYEITKLEGMVANRDQAIFATAQGKPYDLVAADAATTQLPKVPTNYSAKNSKNGSTTYRPAKDSLAQFKIPKGYKIDVFADEKTFPNLANPCQMSFDSQGRLWVGVMPSYPHWRPGDVKPSDKLLIYEDTDGDGKADKETVWTDQLHLLPGFELATNKLGQQQAYCSQGDSLILFTDVDGDDKADTSEVILSGFDDHDSHHAISAFTADPGGGIMMGEGVFIHSAVETAYGPVRGTNGGFMRYDPNRKHLERTNQQNIHNPWGITFDDYGQSFFLYTSSPHVWWLNWSAQKPYYGYNPKSPSLLTSNLLRPTSGLEIMSSPHFPDKLQGDIMLCNTIGYRGAKQHKMIEDGTGFTSEFSQDLFSSEDKNFRPVDLEIAPDGSLYFLDWHNVLIGHMQHNARDPLRDHAHGRIYRLTYPSRPLVKPAKIDGASIDQLLSNLERPEARTRYRTQRELRSRKATEVIPQLNKWTALQTDERLKLEGLWASWGLNAINIDLLQQLCASTDHRIRSAAVNVIRYNRHKIDESIWYPLLKAAATDNHGRVRLTALNISTYLPKEQAKEILSLVKSKPSDSYLENPIAFATSQTQDELPKNKSPFKAPKHIAKKHQGAYKRGHELYNRDGYCVTCHMDDGKGVKASMFPPLNKSEWVNGDLETLIKITLHGVAGPITVNQDEYNAAMMPFGGLLKDQEIADVLFYIRNSWNNKNPDSIDSKTISKIRQANKNRTLPWTTKELPAPSLQKKKK